MNLAAALPATVAAAVEPYLHCRRWLIAYSGGVDSHVLLHVVAALRERMALPPLAAIHINHRLNPRASEWALHCQAICAELGIGSIVETVDIVRAGSGLEAAARAARYAAFEKYLGGDELLLQAHQRDDQTETLLLRLLRGSGMQGLASIPRMRPLGEGHLLRPLLACSRAQILQYAEQQRLHWIHDDSNDDDGFDRNFLRLRILPLIGERWPAYRDTLQRVSDNAAEAAVLLQELAALDCAAAGDGQRLSIERCLQLSAPRQRNLIFYWLRQLDLPLPSSEQMQQVLAMLRARDDARPLVSWPGAELRRFRAHLYAAPPAADMPQDFDLPWNPAQTLSITHCGTLRASLVDGRGLRSDRQYHVRNRRGGERCRPHGRAHSQTLKKLLQDYAVPPWLRERLPLIYCGEQLAAVANLWVCEEFVAAPDERSWRVEWLQ